MSAAVMILDSFTKELTEELDETEAFINNFDHVDDETEDSSDLDYWVCDLLQF